MVLLHAKDIASTVSAIRCVCRTTVSYHLPPLRGSRDVIIVVQPARNFYIRTCVRTCDQVTLTVISISPSRVTSRACAQSLCHVCAPDFFFKLHRRIRTVLFITWTLKECVQLRFVNDKQVSCRPSKGRSA